jgi:hypothetical protein
MVTMLRYFFTEDEDFDVLQEESRGEIGQAESIVDAVVLKVLWRPGGSSYGYDYCMVESKRAGISWTKTYDHLSRHCAGTGNSSGRVYGIVHIGLYVQMFSADHGILTPMSGRLHLRNDAGLLTTLFASIRDRPVPVLE